MKNLKKILNAQNRVFGNFQFLQHSAQLSQKSLSWAQVVSKFEILLNSMLGN